MNAINNPQFKDNLSTPFVVPRNLSNNDLREWLKNKISEIDATNRSIREQMSRYHDETIPKKRGREYYAWIRKAKAKQSHLIEERERLIKILGKTNAKLREYRRIKHGKVPILNIAQAFMMVAEKYLDQEIYREIENKALSVLEV